MNVEIFYDGECPVCSRLALMTRLKENYTVKLHDLRKNPEKVEEFSAQGLDVDEGMVVEVNGSRFYGAEALNFLAISASSSSLLNKLVYFCFRSKGVSQAMYPLLKFGRNVLLLILGKKKIRD